MAKYSVTCTCGHEFSVDAENREKAIAKMKAMLTADTIAKHMADKHKGESPMSVKDMHAMVENELQPS